MLSRIAKLIGRPRLLGARAQRSQTPTIYIAAPNGDVTRAGLWIPVGAADDVRQGTAHFLEHILAEQIAGQRPSAVLRFNALTSFYWTAYTWAGDLGALEYYLTLSPDMLRTVSITPDIIERHRHIIQMELLERQAGQRDILAAASFFRSAFPNEGIHRDIVGGPGDINDIGQEDLLALLARGYNKNGSFLIVCGPRSHLADISRRGRQPTIWLDPENPGAPSRDLLSTSSEAMVLKLGRIGSQTSDRDDRRDCFCAVFDGEDDRRFAFACRGEAFEPEECASALVATGLLEDWLTRDTPGSLLSSLKAINAEPRDLTIQCCLTPELRPLLTGTFLAKCRDAQAVFGAILSTLTASPGFEGSLLQKLKQRALNARFRQPIWSHEGMMRFGAEVATYGLATALSQKQATEAFDLDALKRAWSKFQNLALNLSLNGDIRECNGSE